MSEQHIFLVGPMGAGKTTIGRQLADFLCRPFIDVDNEIEARTGADIQWIFDMEGEEGFRDRETKVLQSHYQIPRPPVLLPRAAVLFCAVKTAKRSMKVARLSICPQPKSSSTSARDGIRTDHCCKSMIDARLLIS